MSTKEIVADLLERLPEEVSLREVAREIEFIAAVREGFESYDRDGGTTIDETQAKISSRAKGNKTQIEEEQTARDRVFWEVHGGGLAWSNSDASDSVMVAQALLAPSFHRLLDIAAHFGLGFLEEQWNKLRKETMAAGYPEEIQKIMRAAPIVERCLRHMHEGLKAGAMAAAVPLQS